MSKECNSEHIELGCASLVTSLQAASTPYPHADHHPSLLPCMSAHMCSAMQKPGGLYLLEMVTMIYSFAGVNKTGYRELN